jgi:hypothetical protein
MLETLFISDAGRPSPRRRRVLIAYRARISCSVIAVIVLVVMAIWGGIRVAAMFDTNAERNPRDRPRRRSPASSRTAPRHRSTAGFEARARPMRTEVIPLIALATSRLASSRFYRSS